MLAAAGCAAATRALTAAGDDNLEAHALLHESASEQATPAVIVGRFLADAVQGERLLRFSRKIGVSQGQQG